MIQEAAKFVDELVDMPKKLELIDTLRTVTDGKVLGFKYPGNVNMADFC
jgi:hypothetical protein